ncbi:hypothetical protein LIA77_04758 [Sarocladium implicatum]|nr:hypothetical protein LIA77_04758 [Sarocladium implicatum]
MVRKQRLANYDLGSLSTHCNEGSSGIYIWASNIAASPGLGFSRYERHCAKKEAMKSDECQEVGPILWQSLMLE